MIEGVLFFYHLTFSRANRDTNELKKIIDFNHFPCSVFRVLYFTFSIVIAQNKRKGEKSYFVIDPQSEREKQISL
jgi:hypothetical protein